MLAEVKQHFCGAVKYFAKLVFKNQLNHRVISWAWISAFLPSLLYNHALKPKQIRY